MDWTEPARSGPKTNNLAEGEALVYRMFALNLSPLLLRIFDPELFHLRKAELLSDPSADYRQWLEPLGV